MEDEKKCSKACRVCLELNLEEYVSLFDNYEDSSIHEHINSLTNIGITESDDFPDKLCSSCLLELKVAIKFKQKCVKSDHTLRCTSVYYKSETLSTPDESLIKEEPEIEFLDSNNFDSDELTDTDNQPTNNQQYNQPTDLKVECHDCGSIFKSKCKLRVHWKKVHKQKHFVCEKCKQTFKSVKAIKHHMKRNLKSCRVSSHCRIEGEGRSRIFYCNDCDYKTLRPKNIETHLVTHSGDRPFKCEVCSKTYTQLSSLHQHQESAHKDYKIEIACQYCGKIIRGRARVYRHLRLHAQTSVQCDICRKVLKNKKSLAVHMVRHGGVKNFICKSCGAMYFSLAELCNHKRQKHSKGELFYNCDLCEYKARKKETIKKHRAKHTGTNCVCTLCGTFLEDEQKLECHQRRHFEKNHECPYCGLRFFRKDSLSSHIRGKHKDIVSKKYTAVVVKQEGSPKNNQQEETVT